MIVDRIELRSFVRDVIRLNDWLDEAFARVQVDGAVAADLKLCINEVVANLIDYGFKDVEHPEIDVEVDLQPLVAKASIIDNGEHFDMRDWQPPRRPRDLMTEKLGGFGIALIRERASVDYARVGDRNVLRLVCQRTGS